MNRESEGPVNAGPAMGMVAAGEQDMAVEEAAAKIDMAKRAYRRYVEHSHHREAETSRTPVDRKRVTRNLRRIRKHLDIAGRQLRRLVNADQDNWPIEKRIFDATWEDLAQSIRSVVHSDA